MVSIMFDPGYLHSIYSKLKAIWYFGRRYLLTIVWCFTLRTGFVSIIVVDDQWALNVVRFVMLGHWYWKWNNFSIPSLQTTISTFYFQAWSMQFTKLQTSVSFPMGVGPLSACLFFIGNFIFELSLELLRAIFKNTQSQGAPYTNRCSNVFSERVLPFCQRGSRKT